jgi:hypothetical protein
MPLFRVASLNFQLLSCEAVLTLFWIDAYGGGLILPFLDTTSRDQTYGGGRYLFDTVNGSEGFGMYPLDGAKRIRLDFNYAYNPSCAYNSVWVCPLAPVENRLPFAIPAGEQEYYDR